MTDLVQRIRSFLEGLDRAAAAMFLPAGDGKPGAVSFIATLAGRLLLAGLVALIILWVANLIRGPFTSEHVTVGTTPTPGIVYALPRTAIEVSSKLTIFSCRLVDVAGKPNIELSTKQTIAVRPVLIADSDYRYVIKHSSVANAIVADKLAMALTPEGTLSSFGQSSSSALSDFKSLHTELAAGLEVPFSVKTASGARPEDQAIACRGLPIWTAEAAPPDTSADAVAMTDRPNGISNFSGVVSEATGAPKVIDFQVHKFVDEGPTALVPDEDFLAEVHGDVKALLLQAALVVSFTSPRGAPAKAAAPPKVDGILYRYADNGTVLACRGECPSTDAADQRSVLLQAVVPTLERGQEATLPVDRGLIGDRSVDFAFSSTGGLQSVGNNQSAPK